MKKTITELYTIVTIGVLSACNSAVVPVQNPVRTVENYDWTPPETMPAKSADITFLLVNPTFDEGLEYEEQEIFAKFRKNIGTDFEEMLVAKGYSIRGPYDTYDEIVYKDKQDSDLIMNVEIAF